MKSNIRTMKSQLQRIDLMLLLFFLPALFMNGCSTRNSIEQQQSRLYEQQLETENRELVLEVENLQQKLLRKQAEINLLVLSRQHATREVVRTKAKLRSHSSKAEAVANIAEVRTVINSVSAKPLTEEEQSGVNEAEQMVAMSVDALEEGDVDGAFRLSSRAQQLIQPIRVLHGDKKNGRGGVFIVPHMMQVLRDCNVRMAPGMTKILFTLKSGTEVKALAYDKKWIQIETEDNRKGWIYYQLLETIR